jgi:hypothetical protein
MNFDGIGIRRRPNNSISGGRGAPWMLSVSLPEAAVCDRPVSVKFAHRSCDAALTGFPTAQRPRTDKCRHGD